VQRETLDSLKEGVAVFATDGRLKLFNSAFLSIWRLSRLAMAQGPHIGEFISLAKVLYANDATWLTISEIITSLSYQREGAMRIRARPEAGLLARDILSQLKPQMDAIEAELPPGYRIEDGGIEEEALKGERGNAISLMVGLILVVFCLLLQYNSAIKPLLLLDVIEHLEDPEGFLLALRHRSQVPDIDRAPLIVISTPNVAFAAIRLNLLVGRFNYAERGIRSFAVCPGALERTPDWQDHPDPEGRYERMTARIPMRRLGTPEEIASVIAFLAGPGGSYVNGANLVIDGGLTVS